MYLFVSLPKGDAVGRGILSQFEHLFSRSSGVRLVGYLNLRDPPASPPPFVRGANENRNFLEQCLLGEDQPHIKGMIRNSG